jgi:RNA polymerase sigma factor (sigma-70 family)
MTTVLSEAVKERQHLQNCLTRYLDGDKSVKDALIESFFPLAISIAHKYLFHCYFFGIDIDDLYSTGYEAITKAVGRISPHSVEEVVTYISQTIRGNIKNYIRDNISSIHFSKNIKRTNLYIIPKLMADFVTAHSREPTIKEIVELTGLDEKTVVTAISLRTIVFSMDVKTNDDGIYLWDVVADPLAKNEEDIVTSMTLNDIIGSLDDCEKELIIMCFYDNMTQKEVGEEFGCDQTTISRKEKRVLQKIRRELGTVTK